MSSKAIRLIVTAYGEMIDMNGRSIARLVLALVIVAGLAFLGAGVYNAGVSQGLVESGQVVVAPGGYPVAPYIGGWGFGWGHGSGFGFFGFLGTLFFLFLFIALVRAAFGGHRGRRGWGGPGGWAGPGGWGGPGGSGGPGGPADPRGRGPWEARAREIHDDWHRNGGANAANAANATSAAAEKRGPDAPPPA